MPLSFSLDDARSLRRIRGFVFDCDGVLIDSLAANEAYYNMYKARYGLPPMSRDELMFTHTQNVFDSIARIVPPEHLEDALEFRKVLDYREILPNLRREPGIRRLLVWLKAAGFALGVNTNRTDTTGMVFEALDFEGFFDPVMTAGIAPRPKPDPAGMLAIVEAWGMGLEEVAFVGDSGVDEKTARNAGVPFWAYKNPELDADLHVPDFGLLLAALRRAWPEISEDLQGA